ncbi:MAG: NINE protein [Winogradskyella sp.]|uniref:TM2 domain-containing protein n=1 Tax=Winogradskyella sp. TaxID=1883156 RepID=UPI0025EE884F|nr:TM2 domain-containing protein [Winogradskyella sp.]NRB59796.1 NINE protein [Winogradskyella sp.]
MSEENKDLGEELNDMIGDAKESAKRAGEKISQKTSEFAEDAKEKASEFASEAKETAKEFSDGAREAYQNATGDNKKILAGILGIIFGGLGVHKFVLGYSKEGGIMLGLTLIGIVLSCIGIGVFVVWIMGIIGFIEGIIYLTKSDEDFYNTYQAGKKPWF